MATSGQQATGGLHGPLTAHAAPFLLWLAVLYAGGDPLVNYALRCAVASAALLILRPWRWYGPPRLRGMPAAVLVGAIVAAVWVLPESAWLQRLWPGAARAYLRFAVLGTPDNAAAADFAPGLAGWPAAGLRLVGSVLVVGVIEEFFWRGLASRRLTAVRFVEQDPARLGAGAVLLASVAFGFEHARWLVGTLAGLAYAGLYMRTRDVWCAVVAHAVTNALLGAYVLASGQYGFW